VQIAGGEHFGNRSLRTVPDEPETLGIKGRILLEQVRAVISIVKGDIQPTPNEAVAHDDAEDIRGGPQKDVGQLEKTVQSAKAVERSGDETDHARFSGDRPPGNGPSLSVPSASRP
jgi:hypothetical protein